jgi:hypothetical protein
MAANEAMGGLPGALRAEDATAAEPAAGRLRFRRRRTDRAAGADPVAEVLAELVLLREENAQLKAARHQLPSFGRVVGQMRSLPAVDGEAEDAADAAADMLAEVYVLRESLLEVCEELERAMASARTRLVGLESAPATEIDGEDGRDGA